ncbi:phage/plasmid primase, P4 family [Alkalihalophilus marmarensis]|uniref:phage/plasmid primase, P4 family n=1 Tax=Alkalihalophilus marmarensis TaxID=521377 RepID=UPI00203E2150|nr:phage/plasmid primase, P4 family [Alkalihalophilus marmarensis]MCM3489100.1 phage/plasmid primase, P4 family [Alkalihalophilus marmarensis]
MNYDFNRIPDELKNTPQWIVWKSEIRNDKPTKVPYQANGQFAKSNDRSSWSTFNEAQHAFATGRYDGIGFMFSKEDEFIGIDLDDCIEEGAYNELAKDIVDIVDSYTEFSPSGEGLHIIIKGKLPLRGPGTGKKNPELGLEIYRHGRYFTFTGSVVRDVGIQERTEALKTVWSRYIEPEEDNSIKSLPKRNSSNIGDLTNRELWEKMFNSKNGDNIKSLFEGSLINGDHSSTDLALCNYLAFWTDRDSIKMDNMFRESNLYREKWDKTHSGDGLTYGQMTIDAAVRSCPTTISDYSQPASKPYEIYISDEEPQSEKEAKKKDEAPFFRLTELGNAERLVYYNGENIRFCEERGWFIWNGKRWEDDSKRKIEKLAAQTFRALYKESAEAEKGRKKALYEWAQKCERRGIRMNSILDARPMVAVTNEELDNHSYLFNCENGVIDLKTGELYPHDRKYLFTKISSIEYDPLAGCPNWIKFLESIFKNDSDETDYEVINFMQKAIGYTLTGDISEQVMFFLYGTGRNGKSTFINTVQTLLGAYGKQTNSDTFIRKKNDNGINNDIARLDKARFVSAVESEEGQQLSESLVKQITGGEKMMARFMRQEFFEFTPEFKVFFTTNHRPIIKGSDEGIWRRICQVPFKVTIPKDQIDRKLPQKLEAEMSGILRWAVEGCLKWQKEGLEQPESIKKATDSYREDMDILGPFLMEKCLINPLAKCEAKALYEEYKDWCFDNGEIELKNRAFYRALESRGFKKTNGAKNRVIFEGIGLRRENPDLVKQERVNEGVNEKLINFEREKL